MSAPHKRINRPPARKNNPSKQFWSFDDRATIGNVTVIGGGAALPNLGSPGITTRSVALALTLKDVIDFPNAHFVSEHMVRRMVGDYPSTPLEEPQVSRGLMESLRDRVHPASANAHHEK
jgi:hypothetical protein